jgi:hypothetical protein
MLSKSLGLIGPVDAHDTSEAALPASFHARDGILYHHVAERVKAEPPRRLEEDVRRRLPREIKPLRVHTVQGRVEHMGYPGCFQNGPAVLA